MGRGVVSGKKVWGNGIMRGNMENICTCGGPWDVEDDGDGEPPVDEVNGPVL